MIREAKQYSLGALGIGVLVALVGGIAVGSEAAGSVVWGAAIGTLLQVAIFWVLFVRALPGQPGLAHGLGAFVRFFAVAVMAFVGVGALGLSPAPALFSMVACLFGSTLLEAIILQRRSIQSVDPGTVTIRTQH